MRNSSYKRTSNRNWTQHYFRAAKDRDEKREKDALKNITEDINDGWLYFYQKRGISKPPHISKTSLGCFEIN